ncbi:hypothetical protein L1987_08473 [Smallanthus sonchifolius]|uniref:Uncharacterized protein n=1 Tax=Smallanthus sonchifolius TaxID=185202 RepID=A0ACB9JKS1_9ASTR|nr:hypothetical protein L1987_08473 [Smallanthus sonchifolius]
MRPQIKRIETSFKSGTHRHIKILSYSLSSHSLKRKSQIFPTPAMLPARPVSVRRIFSTGIFLLVPLVQKVI